MSNLVTLEWYEQVAAAVCGGLRQCLSRLYGGKHLLSDTEQSVWRNIYAAGAELALAKFTNCYWTFSVNQFHSGVPDVGRDTEVRWVETEGNGLVVRPKDRDDRWYVLTQGKFPVYEIVGCMWGADAKQYPLTDCGKPNQPPCHRVPQKELRRFSPEGKLLPNAIRERNGHEHDFRKDKSASAGTTAAI